MSERNDTEHTRKRLRTSPEDWTGAGEDIGLYLKRRGTNLSNPPGPDDNAFAVYLGKVPDHWGPEVAGKHVVGITHFWTWQVVALELYDSVEAMRQVWQLD